MESDNQVYIVDDDPAARDSVAAMVQARGLSAVTFPSPFDFLRSYPGVGGGCLIADMRMPEMTGLELQQHLKRRGSTLPVILITGYGDIRTAVHAMQAGAFSFLEKPCGDEELWSSIRSALASAASLSERHAAQQETRRRVSELTLQERQVLKAMLEGKPNKAIATLYDISLRTVELRRSQVLRKLGASSLAELVRMVVDAGEDELLGPM